MSYEKPEKETEILSADERKLREMCLSLKKVEAPKDFDFKVKTRIADSKASDFQPRFGFAFRYALPAFALILVLGLLAYNSGFWSSPNNQVVAGSSTVPQNPAAAQNFAVSNSAPTENKNQPDENLIAVVSNSPKITEKKLLPAVVSNSQKSKGNSVENNLGGGSKDFSLTKDKTRQPSFPNLMNSAQSVQNDQSSDEISVKDILSMIGINAAFEDGKWTVKSVKSQAENSGFKENDVIEAIENQPISTEKFNGKSITVRHLTVLRDGKKLVLTLSNK